MRLPYKAPKSNVPRRILVEGPSSPPHEISKRPPLSPPTSFDAAVSPAPAPVQTHASSAENQQEEWVEVQEQPLEQQEEQVKQPTVPAKEHIGGQLPAFEPVVQFVGQPSEKKDNDNKANTEPMTAEEKAAAWVAELDDDDDPHATVEDGSIEDCEV